MIEDDGLKHTRTERGREGRRETALVREGGGRGYSGTQEPSDMTQMHCATVQRGREGGGELSDCAVSMLFCREDDAWQTAH